MNKGSIFSLTKVVLGEMTALFCGEQPNLILTTSLQIESSHVTLALLL